MVVDDEIVSFVFGLVFGLVFGFRFCGILRIRVLILYRVGGICLFRGKGKKTLEE